MEEFEITYDGIQQNIEEDIRDDTIHELSVNLNNKERELVSQKRKTSAWILSTFVIGALTLIILVSYVDTSNKLNFLYNKTNEHCVFLGYDMAVVDETAIYCLNVDDVEYKSLLFVLADYLDFYYGAEKYDLRGYSIQYVDCAEETSTSYIVKDKVIKVRC